MAITDGQGILYNSGTGLYDGADVLPWHVELNPLPAVFSASTGTYVTTVSSLVFMCAFLSNSSAAQNDDFSYDIALGKGTWRLTLVHHKGTGRPIYTALIDAVSVGTIDGYNGSTVNNSVSSISSIAVATGGKKRLTIRAATKNASSSGYTMALSWITLDRTA